jgi:glutathione peroxidase
MFAKLSVIEEEAHPLFRWLVASSDRAADPIEWNFAKFIIGRDGRLFKRFRPQVKPDSEEFTAAIQAALAAR